MVKEISLRPYNGRLFFTRGRAEYLKAHIDIFGFEEKLPFGVVGRFRCGEGSDGRWNYLVWASSAEIMAHEFSHVIFYVFDRCGINPSDSGGEAFCYMLSQLMIDAKAK